MPLVFGFNLYGFQSIHSSNRCSSIHQLLSVLKGYSIAWVDLHAAKRGKIIYLYGLLDAEGLVLRGDGA